MMLSRRYTLWEDAQRSNMMRCKHHRDLYMRLQRIEQFIAVVDAGSIRGAARQLEMSQPALSRALQQLEEELGVQLMHRSGRGVVLTDAGSKFLTRARIAEAELRKAAEEARRMIDDGSGLLSLGMSPVGASLLLPELAITLQKQRPKTRIRILEMTPSALLPLVRDEVMDLAVTQRTRIHLDAGLDYRPLAEINMRIAVRPGHPLLATKSVTLHDLAKASWLYMTAHDSADDIVSRSFVAEGLPIPLPVVHCGSYFIALDLLAATDMVGVLPPALLRSCMKSGQLTELVLAKPMLPIHLGMYTRGGSPLTPAGKSAAEIIIAISARVASTGALRNAEPLINERVVKGTQRAAE
jgi:LysR family transcriptional regulator, regulator of abg operon